MATYSSILAQRIQGTQSLVGYSPWGLKELDVTEKLSRANLFDPERLWILFANIAKN